MRVACFFAFTLFTAVAYACSSEPVQAERPDQSHAYLPANDGSSAKTLTVPPGSNEPVLQDIALELCQYSRGAFPNWMQYGAVIPYLAPNEASAIQYVAERLIAEVPVPDRARYLAVSDFIAQNSICTLQSADARRDQTGAMAFAFAQQYPVVPNVPDIDCREPSDTCIAQWVTQLKKYWNGDYLDHPISIVLQPDASAMHYIMRSNIERSFALPLKLRSFWQSLERYEFDNAAQNLGLICDSDAGECKKLQAYLDTDIEFAKQNAARFDQQVSVDDIRFQAVSLTGNSGYVAAELSLTHHGSHKFEHILLKTNEAKPQFCELQASRTYLTNDPLSLEPGARTKSWCILRQNTSPQIKFYTVIANSIE